MPKKDDCYLIIANSARYLAETAAPQDQLIVIDAFGDQDTIGLPNLKAHYLVPMVQGQLDGQAVLRACYDLKDQYPIQQLVLGPGLEGQLETLSVLARLFHGAGNRTEVFAQTCDAKAMAQCFAQLDIPHPRQVDTHSHAAPGLVLQKNDCACGGVHVVWREGVGQAYIPGTAVSHLFLANGEEVCSVGVNTLWSSQHDSEHPFCYGGAINRVAVSTEESKQFNVYASKLTRRFHLCGLNCVDYVLSCERLVALELNPRPSASMQLYRELPLWRDHLNACVGKLPSKPYPAAAPCAHATLYALMPWVCDKASLAQLSRQLSHRLELCDIPNLEGTMQPGPVCSLRTRSATNEDTPAMLLSALQTGIHQVRTSLLYNSSSWQKVSNRINERFTQ